MVFVRTQDIEFHPFHVQLDQVEVAELGPALLEVISDWRGGVVADVGCLVGREGHGHSGIHTALPDLAAVDVERDAAAFPEPAAVVGELGPDLVLTGGNRLASVRLELLEPEEVVAVRRPAIGHVQAPATEGSPLGHDRATRPALRHDDLGGHRVRLVLEHHDRVLRQAAHPTEQDLAVAPDQLGTPGDVGIEALHTPVVRGRTLYLPASMRKRR